MREFIITLLIGVVVGVIDVLPMIKMKLDKNSIASAFVFYLILPFIILNTEMPQIVWWLKGGIIGIALALPVILYVAKEDKKSTIPMGISSVVFGTIIGIVGHFLI